MEGLFSLIILAALIFVMMRFGCGAHTAHGHGNHGGHGRSTSRAETDQNNQVDPVCGMEVSPETGYGKMHAGELYRFCSRECLDRFDAAPENYMTDKEITA